MLNVDTRILKSVTCDQYWLLTHILKRVNVEMSCYPSNKTLCEDTGWEIKKMQRVKAELIEKGLIIVDVRFRDDQRSQTTNNYTIQTDMITVYVQVKKPMVILETDRGGGDDADTAPTPETDNNSEVLTSEALFKEDTPQAADPYLFSKEVIEWLNRVRKKYSIRGTVHWTKQRHRAIEARRKESRVDLPGMVMMFEHRCKSWKGTEFEKYLTPDTLFRPSKFQGYMEQAAVQPAKDWTEKKDDVLEGYEQAGEDETDGGGVPAGFKW